MNPPPSHPVPPHRQVVPIQDSDSLPKSHPHRDGPLLQNSASVSASQTLAPVPTSAPALHYGCGCPMSNGTDPFVHSPTCRMYSQSQSQSQQSQPVAARTSEPLGPRRQHRGSALSPITPFSTSTPRHANSASIRQFLRPAPSQEWATPPLLFDISQRASSITILRSRPGASAYTALTPDELDLIITEPGLANMRFVSVPEPELTFAVSKPSSDGVTVRDFFDALHAAWERHHTEGRAAEIWKAWFAGLTGPDEQGIWRVILRGSH